MRNSRFRFRYVAIGGGSAMIIAGLFATDPAHGSSTAMWLLRLGTACIVLGIAHFLLKAEHDYPEADRQNLFKIAAGNPVGAGLALVAQAIVFAALILMVSSARAAVPPQALPHLPMIASETRAIWPETPAVHYVPALIDHESGCPGLKSCWSPKARLKTAREEGAGWPQLTRAYRPDGSVRFDVISELVQKHPALLSGLNWGNVYDRPDLQVRAMLVLLRSNWLNIRNALNEFERLAMTDACYNGGCKDLDWERRACAVKDGCDPRRWFGHVETTCVKSRAALYGRRSACDINRDHVRIVVIKTMPRYERYV